MDIKEKKSIKANNNNRNKFITFFLTINSSLKNIKNSDNKVVAFLWKWRVAFLFLFVIIVIIENVSIINY